MLKGGLRATGESYDNTKHIIFTCASAPLQATCPQANYQAHVALCNSILAFPNRILIKSLFSFERVEGKIPFVSGIEGTFNAHTLMRSVAHLINAIVATLSFKCSKLDLALNQRLARRETHSTYVVVD